MCGSILIRLTAQSFITGILLAAILPTVNHRAMAAQDPIPAAQVSSSQPADGQATGDQPASEQQQPAPEPRPATLATEGERVAAVKASLEADQKRLTELKDTLQKYDREIDAVSRSIMTTTEAIAAKEQQIKQLTDAGETDAAAQTAEELATLKKTETTAKEQLGVAIAARKTAQEQMRTIETKIAQDQAALDQLLGVTRPVEPTDTKPAVPATGAPPSAVPDATADATQPPATPSPQPPISEKVAQSHRETQARTAEAEAAQQDITQLRLRKQTLERDIELEQQALTTGRLQQDVLDEKLTHLESDYASKSTAGAPAADLQAIRRQINETQQQLRELRITLRKRSDQIQQLHSQLLGLQAEELHLVEIAEQKRRDVQAAKRSEWLVSLQEGALIRGPQILLVILVVILLRWLSRVISHRIARMFSESGHGSKEARRNRAETLASVFNSAARVAIYVGGAIMILDIVGIPVGPLLGGAAVIGLAVAFGAQSLIKDYFTGFIVLLENQYKLKDFVTICGISGTVERITLRITVLRDFEGRVYYIPNGQIQSVANHTQSWSRATVDVDITYQDDIDEVIEELRTLTADMRNEDAWHEIILDDAEVLGVEKLGDFSVSIRMGVKVKGAKQWALKRELLRRIKIRFDELGYPTPMPESIVHNRYDNTSANTTMAESAPPEQDS